MVRQTEFGFKLERTKNQPGETKYIGIPTSDLFYATQGNTLTYRDHLNPKDPGGKLLMIK